MGIFKKKTNKSENPPPEASKAATEEEEFDSKEIEACRSDGGGINIVVNKPDDSAAGVEKERELSHPSLVSLYIKDVDANNDIPANCSPVRISNEWFDMDMVVMLRTPNVDDDTSPKGTEWNQKVADYFRPKQRRFEFQYQVKLKKKPEDKELFYAIQWNEPVKLGIIQRTFLAAILAFLKRTRPTVHYSTTGTEKKEDGSFEKPHLANFIEIGLDRVVITKPGEEPPALGGDIEEDLDHYKARKSGKVKIDFNTEDTYTFALWNANVDWIDWKIVGIPGVGSLDLNKFLGNQPLSILLYMLDKNRGNTNHFQKDQELIVHLEMSSIFQHKDKEEKKKGGFW
ncbi:unnamed protein product [Cylindrotheca closterium]|uniref:Domain of unknown function at the cortex 1 domain-containing protein n=1 Tax=Cylindrotheca closterium TaxID=2856 RepID=A0AAD2G809_9STRA|nr:unnamed protein product [Cylindrotheca closterium]